jgi:alkylhydroperoxidase family enzyme
MDRVRQTEAREAEILGKPPRIAPLKQAEISGQARDKVDRLRAGVGLGPWVGDLPDFTATMLKAPELMDAQEVLANQLFRGKLTFRDRELAILRLAWLCQAPFEWGEHVKVAKRLADVTEEEVDRIRKGSSEPGWTAHERAIIRAVEELVSDAMISDDTWGVLERSLSEEQLLELPILVGHYQTVAYMQNSVRVRLMEGNTGLRMR